MNWTKQKPTKPGVYWVELDGVVTICEVCNDGRGLDVTYMGDETYDSLEWLKNCSWQGPFQVPDPPKE